MMLARSPGKISNWFCDHHPHQMLAREQTLNGDRENFWPRAQKGGFCRACQWEKFLAVSRPTNKETDHEQNLDRLAEAVADAPLGTSLAPTAAMD